MDIYEGYRYSIPLPFNVDARNLFSEILLSSITPIPSLSLSFNTVNTSYLLASQTHTWHMIGYEQRISLPGLFLGAGGEFVRKQGLVQIAVPKCRGEIFKESGFRW